MKALNGWIKTKELYAHIREVTKASEKYSILLDEIQEVDFVAIRREEKVYIQVTYQLGSQATIDREFAPLLAIDDYVVSMDELRQGNIEGVKHRHIADFLLDEW